MKERSIMTNNVLFHQNLLLVMKKVFNIVFNVMLQAFLIFIVITLFYRLVVIFYLLKKYDVTIF